MWLSSFGFRWLRGVCATSAEDTLRRCAPPPSKGGACGGRRHLRGGAGALAAELLRPPPRGDCRLRLGEYTGRSLGTARPLSGEGNSRHRCKVCASTQVRETAWPPHGVHPPAALPPPPARRGAGSARPMRSRNDDAPASVLDCAASRTAWAPRVRFRAEPGPLREGAAACGWGSTPGAAKGRHAAFGRSPAPGGGDRFHDVVHIQQRLLCAASASSASSPTGYSS